MPTLTKRQPKPDPAQLYRATAPHVLADETGTYPQHVARTGDRQYGSHPLVKHMWAHGQRDYWLPDSSSADEFNQAAARLSNLATLPEAVDLKVSLPGEIPLADRRRALRELSWVDGTARVPLPVMAQETGWGPPMQQASVLQPVVRVIRPGDIVPKDHPQVIAHPEAFEPVEEPS